MNVKTWENLIGHTPLVRLDRISEVVGANVFAKLEMLNIGGSMKDRPSHLMITSALASGEINHETIIIESSSGNMAIGMAQTCLRLGLSFICVADKKMNSINAEMIRVYGGKLVVVEKKDDESYLEARLRKVQELIKQHENSFWPNQYVNPLNPKAHESTMKEILDDLDGSIIDQLFIATGTCGTIRGCADYVHRHFLNTRIIAVDSVGSVIFGGESKPRLIPGYGSSIRPALYQDNMADEVIHVTEPDLVEGCHILLAKEAIFAGGSAGALISALLTKRDSFLPKNNIVLILPDRGERYIETVYNNNWVKKNLS